MPHFVVDCSAKLIDSLPVEIFYREIHYSAAQSGLFAIDDIKVRLRPFEHSAVGGYNHKDFIHIFAHIMEGRTVEQKADLSKRIVSKLNELFPNVSVISMNVYEFEKATYCNLATLAETTSQI